MLCIEPHPHLSQSFPPEDQGAWKQGYIGDITIFRCTFLPHTSIAKLYVHAGYMHLSKFEELVAVVWVLKLLRDVFHPQESSPVFCPGLLQVLEGEA